MDIKGGDYRDASCPVSVDDCQTHSPIGDEMVTGGNERTTKRDLSWQDIAGPARQGHRCEREARGEEVNASNGGVKVEEIVMTIVAVNGLIQISGPLGPLEA